jgi:hypothetical protein
LSKLIDQLCIDYLNGKQPQFELGSYIYYILTTVIDDWRPEDELSVMSCLYIY